MYISYIIYINNTQEKKKNETIQQYIFGSNYTEMEGIQLNKVDKSCYQCILQKILLFQKNSYHQKYFLQTFYNCSYFLIIIYNEEKVESK